MFSVIYNIYNVTYKISYMKEIIFSTTKKKKKAFSILNHSGHINIVFVDKIHLITKSRIIC